MADGLSAGSINLRRSRCASVQAPGDRRRPTGKTGGALSANPDMSGRHTTPAAPPPSSSPVVEWRRRRLLAAGFAPGLAAALARGHDVDLHALLDLIDHGCPPPLAARILAPVDPTAAGRCPR